MLNRLFHIYRSKFWSHEKYARYQGVKIGKNCSIGTRYFGSEPYLITIGDNVQITTDVRFFTHGGGWVFRQIIPNFDIFGKIFVGNNVYIGNCALIMPGITIGNGVIIGAGSIVTKSVPSGVIIAGNPAKIIGNVSDLQLKLSSFNLGSKGISYNEKKNLLLSLDSNKFIVKPYLS